MFVLLVLVGCLTEAVFEDEYGEAICAGIEFCGDPTAFPTCPDPDPLDIDCATWDAEGAQACLDSLETSCGSLTPECQGWPFCGQ